MSRRLAAALLTIALVGCATTLPQTPAQTVFVLKSEYAAALGIAAAYHDLPTCPSGTLVCKDPTTVVRIQAAVLATNASLNLAEDAVRGGADSATAVKAATDAVVALEAITSAVKVR